MKELYDNAFGGLYKWGKKAICDSDGEPIHVHFDYLHKAPCPHLVYRGIESDRRESQFQCPSNQVRDAITETHLWVAMM